MEYAVSSNAWSKLRTHIGDGLGEGRHNLRSGWSRAHKESQIDDVAQARLMELHNTSKGKADSVSLAFADSHSDDRCTYSCVERLWTS